LVGLKLQEAVEAMRFFPPSGITKGRHTTDEFLEGAWLKYARRSLYEWNSRRRVKLNDDELESKARSWVVGRARRARRFLNLEGEIDPSAR
jgi:hypothetical protein